MSKVFRVTPKRVKRVNGQVLTPEMSIIVTCAMHVATPFYNGAKEIRSELMEKYHFDYAKACCNQGDFNVEKLD